jgi:hypothetical protein
MGTPEAEIMAGLAFIDKAANSTKRVRESMKNYAQRTKTFCSGLTGYTNQLMQVFEDIDVVGMEDLKSFDEAHIDLATTTLERMTKLFNDLILSPLADWSEAVKERKKSSKEFVEIKKKRDHYEKKINGIKDKLAKGKAKVEYLRKNEEKLKQWKQQYAASELKAVQETRKFKLEHCKMMRTCVARLIQFETQLFKELGSATGKLDSAVKNLLDHTELEDKLRRGAFKLDKDNGSGENVLEKRLSDMEKRFEAMNNADGEEKNKKPKPKDNNSNRVKKQNKKLPEKPKSRKSLTLHNSNINEKNSSNNNDDWGAGVFDNNVTEGNDDWGFGDTSLDFDAFNNNSNGDSRDNLGNQSNNFNNNNIDFSNTSDSDGFGNSNWETTPPNIRIAKTSSSSSGNDQSNNPWSQSPKSNTPTSSGGITHRNNSTDAWPSPAAASSGNFVVTHEDSFAGNSNNDHNKPQIDGFGTVSINNQNKSISNNFDDDDFGFSSIPNQSMNSSNAFFGEANDSNTNASSNNNSGMNDDVFGIMNPNNTHSNDKSNVDIFGMQSIQNQNNSDGMDDFFESNSINTNSNFAPPNRPAPRKQQNSGTGGSNPFLDF